MILKVSLMLKNHLKNEQKSIWQEVQSNRGSLDSPWGEKLLGCPRKKNYSRLWEKSAKYQHSLPLTLLPCEQLLVASRAHTLASTRLSICRYPQGWPFIPHHLRNSARLCTLRLFCDDPHKDEDSIDTIIFLTFGVSWYFGISPHVLNVLVALVWPRPAIVVFILPFSLPVHSRVPGKTGRRLAQHTHSL